MTTASQTVLLTGRGGQLGQALIASIPPQVNVIATGRDRLDLADAEACHRWVREHRPGWVINAGAYTAVDQAEKEPDAAMAINAAAPGALAEALAATGGRLLQISTDFVFNGEQGHPYAPDQPVDPIGVYGSTKAEGERRVRAALPADRFCILRTSWVYGPVGRNFCLTMLRLHARKAEAGEPLPVVADQVGCPTATHTLAEACWKVVTGHITGMHHWSDAGAASWYDFADAIGELGVQQGLLRQRACVIPITTEDYPTPAKRPPFSLLACTTTRQALGLQPRHWRQALSEVLAQIETPLG
jgi:dTDP-4-dehydrorhamnose reductase